MPQGHSELNILPRYQLSLLKATLSASPIRSHILEYGLILTDDAKDKRLPICHLNSLYRHELFASRRCLILPITPEISVRFPSGGIGEMPSLLIFLKCCNTDLQKLRTYRTKLNYIKMTRLGLSMCTKK